MKLHILSDLHNEISFHRTSLASQEANVIVLAGDVWNNDKGLYWSRKTWPDKEILYVAGNHEFYRENSKEVISNLYKAAKKTGVHFLDDDEVVINDVRFLGATLWTDFEFFGDKKGNMIDAVQSLNDFSLIYEGEWTFSPMDSVNLHNKSLAFLESKLSEKFVGKTVVVTHHLPSKKSVAKRYIEDPISACFASHLDRLFGKSEIWVHGHTHDSFDYVSNGTRVICNPRGYCRYEGAQENGHFNTDLIIEI